MLEYHFLQFLHTKLTYSAILLTPRSAWPWRWLLTPWRELQGFLKIVYFLLYIVHYYLTPLYPASPKIITLFFVSMSPFSFSAQCLHSQHPSSRAVSLFSIYESVSVLLVSSVCSLDTTYVWNQMVFVFLWLAYFT